MSYKAIELFSLSYNISPMKMRKILITEGVYKTDISCRIAQLKKEGKTLDDICMITGLKQSAVNGYLPYSKGIYNNEETGTSADRIRLYRKRKKACAELQRAINDYCAGNGTGSFMDCNDNSLEVINNVLWNALLIYQGFQFQTTRGLNFRYTIKNGEMFVSRKEQSKSLTKSSIYQVFSNALELQQEYGYVKGPKKLGTFGASYLYPIFIMLGIITASR